MEAAVQKRTQINHFLYSVQKGIRISLVLLFEAGLLYLLFGICLRPLRISGYSMEPTLEKGNIVLVNRIYRFWEKPQRGDLIVFEDERGTFVKRIIGFPGETVEVISGEVFIDSCPVEESYANQLIGDASPLLVPEGSVYVLGDNRSEMYDSRMEEVGCIPLDRIEGIVRIRLFPLNRIVLFRS